jgi:hypothetical protein
VQREHHACQHPAFWLTPSACQTTFLDFFKFHFLYRFPVWKVEIGVFILGLCDMCIAGLQQQQAAASSSKQQQAAAAAAAAAAAEAATSDIIRPRPLLKYQSCR